MNVAENLQSIQENIRQACAVSNRSSNDISIIAVTKYVTIERTEEALVAGVTNIGENRLEGFQQKYDQIRDQATWHFIGTLQSRKVKDIIDKVDVIHSLDRKSLAKEIQKRSTGTVDCFIQVNISGEETKHGLAPEQVVPFMEMIQSFDRIRVVGLMTMAPHVEDEEIIRNTFRELRALRDHIKEKHIENAPCPYLSMGRSNDYRIAIEEGATHVRIGSKLVGSQHE